MKDPVRDIELIKVFANAFVIWLVVMGFWPMDSVQQAATLTMFMAGINLGGAYIQNRQTTPLAAPRDVDNVPLTRPDDKPAIKELAALQSEAIEINKGVTAGGN